MDPSSLGGRLLARSDGLLERIELLRLRGNRRLPTDLRDELANLDNTIRGDGDSRVPITLASAHHYVFDLQSVLMPSERAVSDSRQGMGRRGYWKHTSLRQLALPAREESPDEEAWVEAVGVTVRRAYDRWSLLSAQAARADGLETDVKGRLGQLRSTQSKVAHRNYEHLRMHAERLIGKVPQIEPVPSLLTTGSLRSGDLVIEAGSGAVRRRGVEITLTPMEKQTLMALSANPGRVLSRELLLRLTHGDEPSVDLGSRVVDVHVARLRQKLGGSSRIVTVAGVGYRWGGCHWPPRLEAGIAISARLPRPTLDQNRELQLGRSLTNSQQSHTPGRVR
jgi:hypothetical protein